MRIAATLGVDEGSRVARTIVSAINEAKSCPEQTANFNCLGVTIAVNPDSVPRLIFDEFLRVLNGRLEGVVGPYPIDIPIEDLSVPSLRARIEAELAFAEPMAVNSEPAWTEFKTMNRDVCGYAQSMVEYIERWARLMQVRIRAGQKIEDVAIGASYEADFDGIRLLVFQRAMVELSLHWKFGKELLRERWRGLYW